MSPQNDIVYSNIFYFKKISKIGGTEQYLWEIAKKYSKYDITIVCDDGDKNQISRLREKVRVIVRKPKQIIKCKKAFLNFNDDILPYLEAEETIFVSHAIYQEIGYKPPIHHDYDGYMGVSQYSCDKLEEYAKVLGKEIHAKKCYNPLTLEPKEKVMIFVSACRLDDKTKGGARTIEFIKSCDRYAEKNNRHYLFLIFTNKTSIELPSINCVYMKPRVDVRPYIAMADAVVTLSNDMETYCYTNNEALGYGVPIVTTPLTVNKELGIDESMSFICNWDMSNVDEVVKELFEGKPKKFNYTIPEDDWENNLVKIKSYYEEEKHMKVKVKCIRQYIDNELTAKEGKPVLIKNDPEDKNYIRIVEKQRADYLESLGLVEIIEIVDEIKKEKAVKPTKKVEKK